MIKRMISSFSPGIYQHLIERIVSFIPPGGILYEDLRDKVYRLYCSSPEFVKEHLTRLVLDMEKLGVIAYNSELMKVVPGRLKRDMRSAYNLLKSR